MKNPTVVEELSVSSFNIVAGRPAFGLAAIRYAKTAQTMASY